MGAIPSTGVGRGYTISSGAGTFTFSANKGRVFVAFSQDAHHSYTVTTTVGGRVVTGFGQNGLDDQWPSEYEHWKWHGPRYSFGFDHPGGVVTVTVEPIPGHPPVRYSVSYATPADKEHIYDFTSNYHPKPGDWVKGIMLNIGPPFYDPEHPYHWYFRHITGAILTTPPLPYPDQPNGVNWIPTAWDGSTVTMEHWVPPGGWPDNPFNVEVDDHESRWGSRLSVKSPHEDNIMDVWSVSYAGASVDYARIQKEAFDENYYKGPEFTSITIDSGNPDTDLTTHWPEFQEMLIGRASEPLSAFPTKNQSGAIAGEDPITLETYGGWSSIGGEIRYYINVPALGNVTWYEFFKTLPGKLYVKTPGGFRIADEFTRESSYWFGTPYGADPYPEMQAMYVKAPDGQMSLLLINWEDYGYAPYNDTEVVEGHWTGSEYNLFPFYLMTPHGWRHVAFAMDAIGMPSAQWMFGFNPQSPYATYPEYTAQNPTTEWSGGGTFTGDPGYTTQQTPTTSSGTPGSGFTG